MHCQRPSGARRATTGSRNELGGRTSREHLGQLADAAARLRSLESHHTLQRIRAEAANLRPHQYVRIESLEVGGGMALAGRLPHTLLIDLRGRGQADGSKDIAQTAQQLGELYKARFGDTRHVAGPRNAFRSKRTDSGRIAWRRWAR